MTALRGPFLLDPVAHDCTNFDCGDDALNEWLRTRAARNAASGASVTWVAIDERDGAVGYYAAATGAVVHRTTSGRVRRNQPDPMPALILGRLAVDTRVQGQGVGRSLLLHFLRKSLEVAQRVGVRLILVHAKSEPARDFYRQFGFTESPVDDLVLHLLISDLRASLP